MGTFIFPDLVILHTPKTGGNWFPYAVQYVEATAIEHPREREHLSVASFMEHYPEHAHKQFFACVRNPYTWWQSYWRYKTGNWDHKNLLDVQCHSDVFEEFITNMVKIYPGNCSFLFDTYTQFRAKPIAHIGRTEHLVDDFISVLSQYYPLNESAIRAIPPQNTTQETSACAYTPELAQEIFRTERDAFEYFGYAQTLPPKYLKPETDSPSGSPGGGNLLIPIAPETQH